MIIHRHYVLIPVFHAAVVVYVNSYNIEVPIDAHFNTDLVKECLNSYCERKYCVCHDYNIGITRIYGVAPPLQHR